MREGRIIAGFPEDHVKMVRPNITDLPLYSVTFRDTLEGAADICRVRNTDETADIYLPNPLAHFMCKEKNRYLC